MINWIDYVCIKDDNFLYFKASKASLSKLLLLT